MELTYNDVRMELLHLDRVERDAVYSEDGQDLLYIKWLIGATCMYGANGRPVGTSAISVGADTILGLNGRPTRAPATLRGSDPTFFTFTQETNTPAGRPHTTGQNALVTDAELRTRLWTPRKQLIIGAWEPGGTFARWLESPKPGFVCDLAGGPKPLAVDVMSATGEGTSLGVHFQIETAVSPCQGVSDQTVLSHRWQMQHTHDEDNYLTRIINGTIVFNMAFIATNGIVPDTVRAQMFHPIPLGFKRTLGPITQSSDGSTIKYTIFDTDQTVIFDAGDSGATQMEIVEQLEYMQPWRVFGGGPVKAPNAPEIIGGRDGAERELRGDR